MAQNNLLYFIYGKLKRFEVHREQVVYDLLPSNCTRTFFDVGCGDDHKFVIVRNFCENSQLVVIPSWRKHHNQTSKVVIAAAGIGTHLFTMTKDQH